ncbi:MAG: peptide deformylase [Bacteroidales bacterium]|nr:peptide deformylase [Bacteroidales bacterium]
MIYPIIPLGNPVLRKVAEPITAEYPDLKKLIGDMFETMYEADGVGLAAPQIGLSIRLLTIGYHPYDEETKKYADQAIELVMINPEILEFVGDKEYFNEGCLSIPDIHEDVLRNEGIIVKYYDADFNLRTEELHGMTARIAQHEIDHLEGKVFTDRLSPLRKTMIKRKINNVMNGKVKTLYRMKLPMVLLLAGTLITLAACTSQQQKRDKQVAVIEAFEGQHDPMGLDYINDKQVADSLIGYYESFADQWGEDSLAPNYLYKAGCVAKIVGEYERSLSFFDRALEYSGFEQLSDCLIQKGQTLEQMGRYDDAKTTYQQLIADYPNHPLTEDLKRSVEMFDAGFNTPEEQLAAILAAAEDK